MNCSELEARLCDYMDGTLPAAQRAEVERHLAGCESCAELAKDVASALGFLDRVPEVEPPPELVTRILFDISTAQGKAKERAGLRGLLGRLLEPVLQPRFAMGMAMTVLSFSMLARFAGINVHQLKVSDLDPVKIWQVADDRAHRAYVRAVKFYESLRFVYEVRNQIRELTAQQQEDMPGAAGTAPAGTGETKGSPQIPNNQGAPGRAPNNDRRGVTR